jgi:hypothetical protein
VSQWGGTRVGLEVVSSEWDIRTLRQRVIGRVSSETSFVSKQPKLEPKLVSELSETRRLFRLFRFNIETGSFSVSKQPKQRKKQPKQQQVW